MKNKLTILWIITVLGCLLILTACSAGGYNNPVLQKVDTINRKVNAHKYIADKENYGIVDYWASEEEFNQKGGDCEDFVNAKYQALIRAGIAQESIKYISVKDHAMLGVVVDGKLYVMDNQSKWLENMAYLSRYKDIAIIEAKTWRKAWDGKTSKEGN